MINKSIFKSYDIRGIYPAELNEEAAFAVGKAFIEQTGAKTVVVGHDARLSSPVLCKALAAGLNAAGATVSFIGQLPTEALYFAVGNYDFDAGIMITASHNPKEYNGFKMIKREGKNVVWIRGQDLLPILKEDDLQEELRSEMSKKDILEDYGNYISAFNGEIKPFKIVVDASNGVIGNLISIIKNKLPVEIIDLNFEPNGNFPNHSPNPLAEGASNQIREVIKKEHADFGFMFDGDADRIFLVDEQGELVRGDVTLLLLAKYFLNKNPGMAIAYNVICSKAVPEFVKKWGGVPIRTPVGFVNVREGLINNNGIMGGEPSCHYCFRDYFYMDSGMIAFLTLLQIISQEGKPVSEMAKELSPYFKSAELNFEVENKEAILEKIKQTYADGKQDFLDGVTAEYEDWWFNVRPSNTEPLLRLTIEANTEEILELKKKELAHFIAQE